VLELPEVRSESKRFPLLTDQVVLPTLLATKTEMADNTYTPTTLFMDGTSLQLLDADKKF
jgi:hypothetical protein